MRRRSATDVEGAVGAAGVDEGAGRLVAEAQSDDLADDDRVVAAWVHAVGAALQPGARLLQDRGAGHPAGEGDPVELAVQRPASGGEPVGDRPGGRVEAADRP